MSKIAYATKVENSGATAAGRASAADMNEIKTSVNALYDTLTYKSFVFQLTQSGTGNPTITTLFNNTGLNFTASRVDIGAYLITPNTPPAQNKTAYFGGTYEISIYYDGDFLNINTKVSGSPADSALAANPFEFRIYP